MRDEAEFLKAPGDGRDDAHHNGGAPREAAVADVTSGAGAPSASDASSGQPDAEDAPEAQDAPDAEQAYAAEDSSENAELDAARREAAQHLDDLRRLKAEFENYRKRVLKEQTNVLEYATQQMIERLLPVLDNFELALLASDRTKDYEKLVRGVELVFGEMVEILHKEGVSKIDAEGMRFDPAVHEAVLQGEDQGQGEPVVVEVLRPGYKLKGRVIRPAMVKVARR